MSGALEEEQRLLKNVLDRLYKEYDFNANMLSDPIEFPHNFRTSRDIEAAGFISSCLAYGKVDLFKPVLRKIVTLMGRSPYDFLINFSLTKHRHLFAAISYRFNNSDDITALFYVMHQVLKRYGSIEAIFKQHYRDSHSTIEHGLNGLVDTFLDTNTSAVYGRKSKPRGFIQFFPSPKKGSGCKRMNLFLRWMIRDRDIDFGIWKDVPKNKLLIPLDTHIARISKCFGLTKRVTQDWKMAAEITGALKMFDPEDPLKYDFALCHQGISKLCSKMNCKDCRIRDI